MLRLCKFLVLDTLCDTCRDGFICYVANRFKVFHGNPAVDRPVLGGIGISYIPDKAPSALFAQQLRLGALFHLVVERLETFAENQNFFSVACLWVHI